MLGAAAQGDGRPVEAWLAAASRTRPEADLGLLAARAAARSGHLELACMIQGAVGSWAPSDGPSSAGSPARAAPGLRWPPTAEPGGENGHGPRTAASSATPAGPEREPAQAAPGPSSIGHVVEMHGAVATDIPHECTVCLDLFDQRDGTWDEDLGWICRVCAREIDASDSD